MSKLLRKLSEHFTNLHDIFMNRPYKFHQIPRRLKVKQFPLTNWPYSLDNILYLNHTLLLNAILTK